MRLTRLDKDDIPSQGVCITLVIFLQLTTNAYTRAFRQVCRAMRRQDQGADDLLGGSIPSVLLVLRRRRQKLVQSHKVKQICNLAEIKNYYKCRSALPSSSVLTLSSHASNRR
jgi:hypothetical protein